MQARAIYAISKHAFTTTAAVCSRVPYDAVLMKATMVIATEKRADIRSDQYKLVVRPTTITNHNTYTPIIEAGCCNNTNSRPT
jgi:hypothetical protein